MFKLPILPLQYVKKERVLNETFLRFEFQGLDDLTEISNFHKSVPKFIPQNK